MSQFSDYSQMIFVPVGVQKLFTTKYGQQVVTELFSEYININKYKSFIMIITFISFVNKNYPLKLKEYKLHSQWKNV